MPSKLRDFHESDIFRSEADFYSEVGFHDGVTILVVIATSTVTLVGAVEGTVTYLIGIVGRLAGSSG